MQIKFWGVRGSIPTPPDAAETRDKVLSIIRSLPDEVLTGDDDDALAEAIDGLDLGRRSFIGGNTSCTEVVSGDTRLVFDCGTGLRRLGLDLLGRGFGDGRGEVHLFSSHTHYDHIQGFPFFVPAYIPGNRIILHGAHSKLADRFRVHQSPAFFPVPLEAMAADIRVQPMRPGTPIEIGDLTVTAHPLHHPGDSYAYRVDHDGRSFVYATDAEYKKVNDYVLRDIFDFFRDADVLVFDAQYTFTDAIRSKEDWGHSSAAAGMDIAVAAGVRRLLLYHHEPTYSDEKIRSICERTRELRELTHPDSDLRIDLAVEEMVIEL